MDPILDLISRANQRGGRMLSVVDLLTRGTLTLRQAAWLLARVEAGASWLVGARPGGAGKTAVMCALLGMVPPCRRVFLTEEGSGWEQAQPGDCVVAYEIGPGPYDAYIWGADVRRLVALGAAGCRIVANLHVDTLAEARVQLEQDNGVPAHGVDAFGIFIGIAVTGAASRAQRTVRHMDAHTAGGWCAFAAGSPAMPREEQIAGFLETCAARGCLHVDAVRQAWLDWREKASDQ